ncbi:MAG: PAQR family membrane homeostasis protein TrhA [Planctomycetota bacterium]|jgi:hemolysin III
MTSMIDIHGSTRPQLRGVSHLAAFFVACLAGVLLVANAPSGRAVWAAGIYAASLVLLFGISALYHRPGWSQSVRRVLRRIDLSVIFLLIAGTYTPFCLLAIPGALGYGLLTAIWILAAAGIAKAVLWTQAPRVITAGLYVAVGFLGVPFIPTVADRLQATNVLLIVAGGALYVVGAVVYALRRPDPLPRLFGYHEVFHLLVIGAGVCHFAAVTSVVTTPPAA